MHDSRQIFELMDYLEASVFNHILKKDVVRERDNIRTIPFNLLFGKWKSAANSKSICFSTKWCLSYIVFALKDEPKKWSYLDGVGVIKRFYGT